MEAGAPAGVLQVVNGDKETVDAILEHPDIHARELCRFVGGRRIRLCERGAAAGKRVQAMGGAKNHAIIMPDADLDQAVNEMMGAGYGSAGERCMAISVVVPVTEKTARRAGEQAEAARGGAEGRPADRCGGRLRPAGHGRAPDSACSITSTRRQGRRRARGRRPRLQDAGLRERLLSRRLAVRPRDDGA